MIRQLPAMTREPCDSIEGGEGGVRINVRCRDARLTLVHEDGELLVVHKPADLVCHPTKGDVWSSLVSRVRIHAGLGPEGSGGESGYHLLNRLDRETSGLVLFAKGLQVARELRRLWEAGQVSKKYLALVHGHPLADEWLMDGAIGPAVGSRVVVRNAVRPDGAASRTWARVCRRFERGGACYSVLEVCPETGRKHQIRVHLAHAGHPIVGDKIYGEDEGLYLALVEGRLGEADRERLLLRNHGLHAGEVSFLWRGVEWSFRSDPEPEFLAFSAWTGCGPGR